MKWLEWLKVPAIVVGCVVAAGTAADYLGIRPVLSREMTELKATVLAMQTSQQLMRWQYLEEKRKVQGLTVEERYEYCALSHALGFSGAGCV